MQVVGDGGSRESRGLMQQASLVQVSCNRQVSHASLMQQATGLMQQARGGDLVDYGKH